MEKFPQKKSSNTEKVARAALAGAAMMGAVGAAEPAAADQFKPLQRMETQQSAVESNATGFLSEIADMDIGIADARGQSKLHATVDLKFNAFVARVTGSNTVTMESRAAVAKILLDKIGHLPPDSLDNDGINTLEEILKQSDVPSNQQKSLRNFFDQMQKD